MTKLILGIGLPGSGKTTVLKKFAEKYDYVYICPDDIRRELTGSAEDQSMNGEVWQEAYNRLAKAIGEDETVVFDATMAKRKDRKAIIDFARDKGVEKVQGVYLDVPFSVAGERNLMRDRVVPDDVMDQMMDNLEKEPPKIEDGFDSIFTLDEFGELKEAEAEVEDELAGEKFR